MLREIAVLLGKTTAGIGVGVLTHQQAVSRNVHYPLLWGVVAGLVAYSVADIVGRDIQ
jgi:hypothetical protein